MVTSSERTRSLPRRWAFVMTTCNPPPGHVDPVSRWLVLVRACVLPMTATAAAIAGLLAVRHPGFHAGWFALSAFGMLTAHCANNLMNDLFDLTTSLDTQNYPRALYAPHPVLSGMISTRGLWVAAGVANLISLGVLVVLTVVRGWPIAAFALAGFFVSAGYTAPPLRLKKRGLGEPGVLVVWGPLMVGGAHYAATGTVDPSVLVASLPYALLCTTVLMGKHIDKLEWDRTKEIGTLPARLGEARSRTVTQGMIAAFYVSTLICVVVGALPWPVIVVLGALPLLRGVWRMYSRPRPSERPRGYPVWPLWYASAAFVHTRRAGALLLVGLTVAAVLYV